MKIFVTGITGFVGSHLWDFFNSSDKVYVLARSPLELNGRKAKVVKGDLNTPAEFFNELKEIKPDVCIHLAWEGIPDFSYEKSFKNLQQGAALLRCLVEECGCRKIIVGGTCFEYGKPFGACREDEEAAVNSYFVWAKHSLYNFGKLLASKDNVSFIWFRFFYVYGPGQRGGSLIPTLADTLIKNEFPAVKTPLNANDFIYVKDVAEALVLAARKEIPTGIYNLGTGVSVPVWKVCEHLEKSMGRDPLYAKRLREAHVQPTANYWADMSKSAGTLSWSPRIKIEEGIRQYVKSMEIKV
ncbi:MAG: NAD(P)-dependent oxidoreductase [Candidatus Omnitrophica bacterium]|nr:NAD(P)-dependent oxidoreductase [Candidatus Omnitrophota bacterium]